MRKQRFNLVKLITAFIVTALIIESFGEVNSFAKKKSNNMTIKQGDIILFGYYEQDMDETTAPDPIEWIVLKSDGKTALLLSKQGLDCQMYNEEGGNTSWEKSSLRKWLNSDFYNSAFPNDSKDFVISTKLNNPANPESGVSGGKDTNDKVFLLSYEELLNTEYGFSGERTVQDEYRFCEPSLYAARKGISVYGVSGKNSSDWWMRSTGNDEKTAMYVKFDGTFDYHGTGINNYKILVRPAIYLNISGYNTVAAEYEAVKKVKPGKPSLSVRPFEDGVALTINTSKNAYGYEIYMKGPGDKKYKLISTRDTSSVDQQGEKSIIVRLYDLKTGKARFKVRAYSKYGIKGSFSKVIKTIVQKLPATNRKDKVDSFDFSAVKVGQTIKFGAYEQDDNLKNGQEEIEWVVLKKDKKQILVVSKYALDCRAYSRLDVDVTWGSSPIRIWLNDSFYNSAFTDKEKKMICLTSLSNRYNSRDGEIDEEDTKDNVFLLALDDLANTEYGFSSSYEEKDINRRCAATPYAIALGAYVSNATKEGKMACWWWLRTHGAAKRTSIVVGGDGYVNVRNGGSFMTYDDIGIRPAMYIKVKS